MAKSTVRNVIAEEIEAAFESGIMACLVFHCKTDSAEAHKLAGEIKRHANRLPDRIRQAADRIVTSILSAVSDVAKRPTKQAELW